MAHIVQKFLPKIQKNFEIFENPEIFENLEIFENFHFSPKCQMSILGSNRPQNQVFFVLLESMKPVNVF